VSEDAGEPIASVRLDDESIERLADRLADLLATRLSTSSDGQSDHLLTAAEVSQWWGVERSWVYEHATELGAIRLGNGPRPRLRFDPRTIAQHLRADSSPPMQAPPASRRRTSARIHNDPVRLLPIRGHSELQSPTEPTGRPGGARNAPGRGAEDRALGAMSRLPTHQPARPPRQPGPRATRRLR
jgi:hypothetical protein